VLGRGCVGAIKIYEERLLYLLSCEVIQHWGMVVPKRRGFGMRRMHREAPRTSIGHPHSQMPHSAPFSHMLVEAERQETAGIGYGEFPIAPRLGAERSSVV
jgi:hypothetical protein